MRENSGHLFFPPLAEIRLVGTKRGVSQSIPINPFPNSHKLNSHSHRRAVQGVLIDLGAAAAPIFPRSPNFRNQPSRKSTSSEASKLYSVALVRERANTRGPVLYRNRKAVHRGTRDDLLKYEMDSHGMGVRPSRLFFFLIRKNIFGNGHYNRGAGLGERRGSGDLRLWGCP